MAEKVLYIRNMFLLYLYLVQVWGLCPTPSTILTKRFVQQYFLDVVTLDLSSCNLEAIEDGAFAGCSNVTTLKLVANRLTLITNATFTGLTNVQTILLNNNQLSEIMDESFAHMQRLHELHLENNKLYYIREGTFKGIRSYLQLFMSNNYLYNVDENSFFHLPSIRILDMSSNKRIQLPYNVFRHVSSLHHLLLKNCGIKEITSMTFCGLDNLATLDLTSNSIEHISDGALQCTPKLYSLQLKRNGLHKVRRGMFSSSPPLKNVDSLNLFGNEIYHVEDAAFADLSNLKSLDLSQNQLHTITTNMFAGLRAIGTLYLNNCTISHIEEGSFGRLNTLRKLELQYNQLTWLPVEFQHFMCSKQIQRCGNCPDSRDSTVDVSYNPVQCNCDLNPLNCPGAVKHPYYGNINCLGDWRYPWNFTCIPPTGPVIKRQYSTKLHHAVLECESTGDPVPSLTWTIANGTDIVYPPPNNHSILTNTAQLVITLNSQSVFGEYVCNASSNAGWVSTSYWLNNRVQPTINTNNKNGVSSTLPYRSTNKTDDIISNTFSWLVIATGTASGSPNTQNYQDVENIKELNVTGIVVGAFVCGCVVTLCIVAGGFCIYRVKKYGRFRDSSDDCNPLEVDANEPLLGSKH